MKKAPINFRIDQELKDKLVELAKKEDRALSNYIHHILIRHVEDQKPGRFETVDFIKDK